MSHLDYDNIELFTGKEVEHTPTYGMQTLFVNGLPPVSSLLAHDVEHVYMGANHCELDVDNIEELQYYNNTIKRLLDNNYWVSMDFDAKHYDNLLQELDDVIWSHDRFVPIVSVHIERVKTVNKNLTIKITDKVFRGVNGGVWCMNNKELPDDKFTPWSAYEDDEAISYK